MQRGMNKSRFLTTILFYLGSDTRYSYSYNGKLIVCRMCSIEWRHFNDLQRPLTQVSKSRHCFMLISQKRCEIEIWLQWNTIMHLHTPYSRVSFRMTLSDLSEIFNDTKHLRQLSFLLYTDADVVDVWCSQYYSWPEHRYS